MTFNETSSGQNWFSFKGAEIRNGLPAAAKRRNLLKQLFKDFIFLILRHIVLINACFYFLYIAISLNCLLNGWLFINQLCWISYRLDIAEITTIIIISLKTCTFINMSSSWVMLLTLLCSFSAVMFQWLILAPCKGPFFPVGNIFWIF